MSKILVRNLVSTPSDEQIVFLARDGRVAGTKGGIPFVVGGKESDFTEEDPARAKKLLTGVQSGELLAYTPSELYQGVGGDRSKLVLFFTSGGESSSIGAALGKVAETLDDRVNLLVWQGFGTGILPKDEFEQQLVVINDPRVIDRISNTGGSPGGMSRTKLDRENIDLLWTNVEDAGAVAGTSGGDHSKNFKQLWEKSIAEGKPLVVVTIPKSMDLDLALKLNDGRLLNSLMLGGLTAGYAMRIRWFNEFQSAAGYQVKPGEGRGLVGNFFGRGAGWAVFGATRRDPDFWDIMREQGILSDDLYNKMDALSSRQIILGPEYPCSIPEFAGEVNRIYNQGRMHTVGVACSEGFMFHEVDVEYKRIAENVDMEKHTEAEIDSYRRMIKERTEGGTLHYLIKDVNLAKVFQDNPDVAEKFFKDVLAPSYDSWGHPKLGFMPTLVNAVVTTLTDCKKTNLVNITYEARTAEMTPWDRILAELTGAEAGTRIKAGESGLTTVLYEPGVDPFLIHVPSQKATFIPFTEIEAMTESDNNMLALSPEYLRRCGVFIPK